MEREVRVAGRLTKQPKDLCQRIDDGVVVGWLALEGIGSGLRRIDQKQKRKPIEISSSPSWYTDNPLGKRIGAENDEFHHRINPRSFRRRLRGVLGRREGRPAGDRIGRSARCKEVFVAAERAASEAREMLTPVWLLRSVFMSLADVAPGAAVESSEADDIPAEL